MDQQKIDQLFREKLDNYEVLPSNEAWNEVEKRIGSRKSSTKFYWIAASISLLIVAWMVWPQQEITDLKPISSGITHPRVENGTDWSIPQASKSIPSVAVIQQKNDPAPKTIEEPRTVQLVAQEDVIKSQPVEEMEMPALTEETLVESESKTVALEAPVEEPAANFEEQLVDDKIDYTQIKITYIAGSTEKTQKKDSVGAFKKIIAFAGKLSPGEVLADFKTAKDGLINNSLRSKNKNRSSL